MLHASLASLEAGTLKQREDVKLLNTPKESTLLQPVNPFYKSFAVDCSRAQVCVDLFLFGLQYMDVATICKFKLMPSANNIRTNLGHDMSTAVHWRSNVLLPGI